MSINDEFEKLSDEWKKILSKNKYLSNYKKYISDVYNENLNVKPKLNEILNPFKFVQPNKISVIILCEKALKNSCGLAYSSKEKNDYQEYIENKLNEEFYYVIHKTITITDPTFKKLASQGVFMPNINPFNTVIKDDAFKLKYGFLLRDFWTEIFKELLIYSCFVWFSWSPKIDEYLNKILKDKILNAKIRDNMGKNFKGCGCFSRCNEYLIQYNKKIIDWEKI